MNNPTLNMESTENINDNVCRVCTLNSGHLTYCNIFQKKIYNNILVSDALILLTNLIISPTDGYPKVICSQCENRLLDGYHFRKLAESSARLFATQSQNGPDKLAEAEKCIPKTTNTKQIGTLPTNVSILQCGVNKRRHRNMTKIYSKFMQSRGGNILIHRQNRNDVNVTKICLPHRYKIRDEVTVNNTCNNLISRSSGTPRTFLKYKKTPTATVVPSTSQKFEVSHDFIDKMNQSTCVTPQKIPKLLPIMAANKLSGENDFSLQTKSLSFESSIAKIKLHKPKVIEVAEKRKALRISKRVREKKYLDNNSISTEPTSLKKNNTSMLEVITVSDDTTDVVKEEVIVSSETKDAGDDNIKKSTTDLLTQDQLINPDYTDAVSFLVENDFLNRVKTEVELKEEAYKKRKHKCQVCGKKFVGKSNLVDHLRYHANVKPFKCEFCDKKFVQSGSLKCHLRTHTQEKPYNCQICLKAFSQPSSLKVHIRTHTNERNYICDICRKGFMSHGDLSKHKRTHDPIKKFQCASCGKGFSQKCNLQKHMSMHNSHERIDKKRSD